MRDSTGETAASGDTVLYRLIEHIRSKDAVLDGQERPAAILWTDPKAEWLSLIELMLPRAEELLVLGDYRPEARTGPAIWIRCLVDRSLDKPALPPGRAPIIYLPGVARQELRAGDDCRPPLRPLVELMHRGAMWLQPNGSDWTVTAFLTSPKALGLDISRDNATTEALLRALPEVALTPVAQLTGRRLQADDFDRMLAGDVARDLLRWMCDPAATKTRLGANGWGAFCSRCHDEMGFDPETEADVVAGERLGRGSGPWAAVWDRFAESPTSYADIARLLRRSRPTGVTLFDRERWPELNDEAEETLRADLAKLNALPHQHACEKVIRLEKEHGPRRGWVWTRMGISPMARAIEPLARLAGAVRSTIGGTTPDDLAAVYLERGWQADAASWEAIATASTADEKLVSEVVRHILAPWLEDSARAFQSSVERAPLPTRGEQSAVEASDEACLLFADGLRYDLGQRLAERLEARGCRVGIAHRWAALPTVTATAKPAVTPVAGDIVGGSLGEDFAPTMGERGQPANAQVLRDAIRGRGYQIPGEGTLDVPMSHPAHGWTETGEIDSLGHMLGARLARQIGDELDRLSERIISLLDAGWKAVQVVTDHGWLLLPGGLPKVDLPKHLTASRWSRCAVIAGDASPKVLRAPWHWNASQWFATAPGIACFNKSEEYAHGGLSIQECLTPVLVVERTAEAMVAASISSITWRGLRCFVVAAVRGGAVVVDLRLDRPSGPSVAAATKRAEADGSASLVLSGDEHEAASLVLVLLDEAGHILAQKPTRVGVNS